MANAQVPPQPPWHRSEPSCNEKHPPSIYCPKLKVNLYPGTFVIIQGTALCNCDNGIGPEDKVVGRVSFFPPITNASIVTNSAASGKTVEVNLFKELGTQINIESYNTSYGPMKKHLAGVREVIQTREHRTISTDAIVDLAFVFTFNVLEEDVSQHYNQCHGMSSAFILRIKEDKSSVSAEHCLPFPSCYQSHRDYYHHCVPSQTWRSIINIKVELGKILGRESEKQGTFARKSLRLENFSRESWGYLRHRFESLFLPDGSTHESQRKRIFRRTDLGLELKAQRVVRDCELIRFETVAQLEEFCAVFGDTVLASPRSSVPKLGTVKKLKVNDIVNVVNGSEMVEAPFQPRSAKCGIDFEYAWETMELYVAVRYAKYAYEVDQHGRPICDNELLKQLIIYGKDARTGRDGEDSEKDSEKDSDEDSDSGAVVAVGEFFAYDKVNNNHDSEQAITYEIKSIDGETVVAESYDESRISERLDKHLVKMLVKQYNDC